VLLDCYFIQLQELFCWAIRMVRFLIRMNASLKNYIHANQRAQIHTAAELHYYALESGFQCEKLTFCKSDFAASNRVSSYTQIQHCAYESI